MNKRPVVHACLATALLVAGIGQASAQNYYPPQPPPPPPQQVCHDVRVYDQPSDSHRVAGTAIGAVAGGLLGHTVGGGKGKTLATVGGAVAGGYVGNQVQKDHQQNNATYHIERRCKPVGG